MRTREWTASVGVTKHKDRVNGVAQWASVALNLSVTPIQMVAMELLGANPSMHVPLSQLVYSLISGCKNH